MSKSKISVKARIQEMSKLIAEREKLKPGTKKYSKVNSRIQAIRAWLKKNQSLPELPATVSQPIFPEMTKVVENVSIADLLLQKSTELLRENKVDQAKILVDEFIKLKIAK